MAHVAYVLVLCAIMESIIKSEAEPLIFLDSTEIIYMNRSFGLAEISVGKLENGLNGLNASLNITKDVPDSALISLKLYKLDEDTNEYSQVYEITTNLCALAENEYRIVFGEYLENGFLKNFLKGCPIMKGYYYFINGCVPNANFPWIPYWTVKTKTKVFTDSYNILEVDTYAHIKEGNLDDYNF